MLKISTRYKTDIQLAEEGPSLFKCVIKHCHFSKARLNRVAVYYDFFLLYALTCIRVCTFEDANFIRK